MNKCKCGCGADAPEGKGFLPGHWSKWNAKNKANGEQPKVEEPKQPEEPKIIISNIRACGVKSDNVAWFRTKDGLISKELEFFCTITTEKKESCDYVAVVLGDGSIAPAILLPGFVEVCSRHEEPREPKREEKQPEQLEIRDTKIIPPPEKPAILQPDEPINNAIEELRKISNMPQPERKKGLWEKILGGDTHATG